MKSQLMENNKMPERKLIGEENWKGSLYCFHLDMEDKLEECVPRKGEPTKERLKDCPEDFLIGELKAHLELGHWVDVANFAFLLHQQRPLSKTASEEYAEACHEVIIK